MRLVTFQLSSIDIESNSAITGTVTMDAVEPRNVPVLIGSSHPEIVVPHQVMIAPGQLSSSFTIESRSLLPLLDYHVWVQIEETVFRQKLVYKIPGIQSLVFNPVKLDGGLVTRLTVTLDNEAPSTGSLVLLSEVLNYQGESTPLLLDMPSSLFIAANGTSAYCDITTRDWDGGQAPPPREIHAAVDAIYDDSSKRAILTITDP